MAKTKKELLEEASALGVEINPKSTMAQIQKAISAQLRQFIGHHAFDDFPILKSQPHPQTFAAWTGGKGLAIQRLGVIEIPDEIDPFDLMQVNEYQLAAGIQQLQLAFIDKA